MRRAVQFTNSVAFTNTLPESFAIPDAYAHAATGCSIVRLFLASSRRTFEQRSICDGSSGYHRFSVLLDRYHFNSVDHRAKNRAALSDR